jgi:hypothetical protein
MFESATFPHLMPGNGVRMNKYQGFKRNLFVTQPFLLLGMTMALFEQVRAIFKVTLHTGPSKESLLYPGTELG